MCNSFILLQRQHHHDHYNQLQSSLVSLGRRGEEADRSGDTIEEVTP